MALLSFDRRKTRPPSPMAKPKSPPPLPPSLSKDNNELRLFGNRYSPDSVDDHVDMTVVGAGRGSAAAAAAAVQQVAAIAILGLRDCL